MHPKIRVYLYDENDNKFFGEGPCRLLHGVEQTGSLHQAAISMNMAYTKALSIMRQAEESLGFPLTTKKIGGVGGGGSTLTTEAKEFLHDYETYRDKCITTNRQIYDEVFADRQ